MSGALLSSRESSAGVASNQVRKPSAVIEGVQASRQSRFPGSSDVSLATEAVMALPEDCGMARSSIDGLLAMADTTSRNHGLARMSGRGTVETFHRFQRAHDPSWEDRVPHVATLIDLEVGPVMIANVVGDSARVVKVDDPVEVVYARKSVEAALAQLRPTEGN